MCEDDWFKSALSDDSMVAELLIQFRESVVASLKPPVLLEWGVRQPRSRHIVRYDAVKVKKKGELTRASPTTPLSWSAGTSNSGGGAGDGYEESSVRLSHARSKLVFPNESNNKRSRKKKTFAQLKEQEILLSKEAIQLKRAIRSERTLYEAEKVRNEGLKRLKRDLQLQSGIKPEPSTGSSKTQTINHSYRGNAMPIDEIVISLPARGKFTKRDPPFCRPKHIMETPIKERAPVLPDLNMLPDLNLPFDDNFQ